MKENKVAILICFHKNFHQLFRFIKCFDVSLFDIFVHIDRKTTREDPYYEKVKNLPNVSILNEENSFDVNWGKFSLVEAQLSLLKEASKNEYLYYLFCSGQDFLVRKSKSLYAYLKDNREFCLNDLVTSDVSRFERRNKYRIFEFCYKRDFLSKILKKIYFSKLNLFKFLFVRSDYNKIIKNVKFYYGSNWIGINYGMAKEVFDFINSIRGFPDFMKKSLNPDESFFQTILINKGFKFKEGVFYIDWSEGKSSPKILNESDYFDIIKSNKFLARKFDEKICDSIIQKFEEEVGS